MPFQKGKSGNPAGLKPGTPRKLAAEVKALAQAICDREYWKLKYRQMHDGTVHPKIEELILTYAYGKPAQEIHATGTVVHLGPLAALQETTEPLDVSDVRLVDVAPVAEPAISNQREETRTHAYPREANGEQLDAPA